MLTRPKRPADTKKMAPGKTSSVFLYTMVMIGDITKGTAASNEATKEKIFPNSFLGVTFDKKDLMTMAGAVDNKPTADPAKCKQRFMEN